MLFLQPSSVQWNDVDNCLHRKAGYLIEHHIRTYDPHNAPELRGRVGVTPVSLNAPLVSLFQSYMNEQYVTVGTNFGPFLLVPNEDMIIYDRFMRSNEGILQTLAYADSGFTHWLLRNNGDIRVWQVTPSVINFTCERHANNYREWLNLQLRERGYDPTEAQDSIFNYEEVSENGED